MNLHSLFEMLPSPYISKSFEVNITKFITIQHGACKQTTAPVMLHLTEVQKHKEDSAQSLHMWLGEPHTVCNPSYVSVGI